MCAYTNDWEESTPVGTQDASLGDNRIRELKLNIGERFKDMLFGFNTDDATGNEDLYGIKKLRFRELAADPTILVAGDDLFLYAKNVSNVSELFFKNNADAVRQISNAGKLNVIAGDYAANSIDEDDIQLANNKALTALNAAGDGTVNLILAGTNDLPTLPDSAEMASNAAPTENEGIANKKYVDDQFAAIAASGNDSSGSYTFTGGLILKWGKTAISSTNSTISFPAAFPDACFQAFACAGNATLGDGMEHWAATDNPTKTGFGYTVYEAARTTPLRWFAIGR